MADIFREVDEDVRKERYAKLWKAYGRYVIALLVLIVVGTAAGVGWREYTQSAREKEGAQFAAALNLAQSGNNIEAAAAFAELAEDAGGGYGALSRLQEAAALVAAGDVARAIEAYDRLAADGSSDKILRSLGALLAVIHSMDTASPDELERRLVPLVTDESPWRYSARELQALVSYRSGDTDMARNQFQALTDDVNAPQGIRQRAAEMLAAIGNES